MALHADITQGPAGEIPLVLLHGFGGGAFVWQEVATRLSRIASVIAYDLPGHHRSLEEPAGGAGRMAKGLLADLESRGHSRFHLCGHSLGGATAALIALRAPQRIASLTLLAPGGFGPQINAEALAAWRDAVTVEEVQTALTPMAAPGFAFDARVLQALSEARQGPGAAEALAQIYETLFAAPGIQGSLPLEGFADAPFPVRLLWGTEDAILPFSQSLSAPASMERITLEGAGHMLIEERPDAVVAALEAAMDASA